MRPSIPSWASAPALCANRANAVVAGGGRLYLSGMSSKARRVTQADLDGKPAEMAMPDVLVKLAFESDTVLTY